MNATRTTLIVPTWGYKDPKTGKLAGMFGDLLNHRAHIGGTGMFFTPERVQSIDYISMTTSTFGAFVFRAPSLSYTSNIYYLPLSTTVWICSILLVILSTFVVYLAYKHSAHSTASRNFNTESMRVSDFVLIAISMVCQMGSQLYPRRLSGRISTVSLLLLSCNRGVEFLFIPMRRSSFALRCSSFIRHIQRTLWLCSNRRRTQSIHWMICFILAWNSVSRIHRIIVSFFLPKRRILGWRSTNRRLYQQINRMAI